MKHDSYTMMVWWATECESKNNSDKYVPMLQKIFHIFSSGEMIEENSLF